MVERHLKRDIEIEILMQIIKIKMKIVQYSTKYEFSKKSHFLYVLTMKGFKKKDE